MSGRRRALREPAGLPDAGHAECARERFIGHSVSAGVWVIPQAIATVAVVIPPWMIDDRVQAHSVHRHASFPCCERLTSDHREPWRTVFVFRPGFIQIPNISRNI